jgi:BirA family transcriptional regulator, biotin operon repressor / biotin---[acetyl-CoA-carboxylase] ligase
MTTRAMLKQLDIYPKTDSTNQVLLNRSQDSNIHGHVCLAEFQTEGRGRQGKSWVAPPGSGICLSVGWHFYPPTRVLGTLSLAVGIAVVQTLESLGCRDVMIKWPNDLIWRGCKLGGILIETRPVRTTERVAIIGLGLNVTLPEYSPGEINQPVTDLYTMLGNVIPRNPLTANLLNTLFTVLGQYTRSGLESFMPIWRQYDYVYGKSVRLLLSGSEIAGIALGIDNDGALLVQVEGAVKRFVSGEVSLRLL